jgi:hypothetical protein
MRNIIKIIKAEQKTILKDGGKKIKTKNLGFYTLKLASLINSELSHLMPFVD